MLHQDSRSTSPEIKCLSWFQKLLMQVDEYTLTTAWDVSTASFVDSFSVATQETVPTGIAFSKSGEKMFIVGSRLVTT